MQVNTPVVKVSGPDTAESLLTNVPGCVRGLLKLTWFSVSLLFSGIMYGVTGETFCVSHGVRHLGVFLQLRENKSGNTQDLPEAHNDLILLKVPQTLRNNQNSHCD